MSFFNAADKILLRFGRYKVGMTTTNSQPGAHTGNSRQYIPGYSDSNIVYLDMASGNDANSGATELLAKLTYASAATAAGSTKKIRVINSGAALAVDITKPTEMKRGLSGTISSSLTAPVDTWTQAATPSFGTTNIFSVGWSPFLSKFVAGANAGKIAYSTDGNTWTQAATSSFGSGAVRGFASDDKNKKVYAVGNAGTAFGAIAYSTDGNIWTQISNVSNGADDFYCIIWVESLGKFFVGGTYGKIITSTDGATWTDTGFTGFGTHISAQVQGLVWSPQLSKLVAVGLSSSGPAIAFSSDGGTVWSNAGTVALTTTAARAVTWSEEKTKFVAVNNSGQIAYSTDANTWTLAATPSFGASEISSVKWVPELSRFCAVSSAANKIAYSADGDTWTQAATPSFGADIIYAVEYSPLIGKLAAVGTTGKIAYSTAFAKTISANVAGFTIQAVQYSGSVNAFNCTFYQPGTTAVLNMNACRVTEAGAHISNNAQTHFGTLFEGDVHFTSAPASLNAFALNSNTFAGDTFLYNSSATGYEQIRDNINVGDFTANFAVTMRSGNIEGTRTNVIANKGVSFADPVFHDTTDYKLSRLTNADTQDSPLCNKASYYVNEQGQPRDLGAWSEDDSALSYGYKYAAYFNKPAGQGIKPQKVPAASADQGLDGTWDGVNEPERATEWLTLAYQSAVPMDHLTNLDLLESLTDMTCDISLAPDLSAPDTAVVVNGNHAADDIVLNIDASSTIKAGMILEISGVKYFILYTSTGSSPTRLVLHKPLESAVLDNASITPQEPLVDGTYQYVPQMRETPRPHSHETEYANGLVLKFVRQYPQL